MTARYAIYLLSDGAELIKIGVSSWGVARVSNVYAPGASQMRYAIAETEAVECAYAIERRVHKSLAKQAFVGDRKVRSSTEWFYVPMRSAIVYLDSIFTEVSGRQCRFRLACRSCSGFGTSQGSVCVKCRGSRYHRHGELVGLAALERHVARWSKAVGR